MDKQYVLNQFTDLKESLSEFKTKQSKGAIDGLVERYKDCKMLIKMENVITKLTCSSREFQELLEQDTKVFLDNRVVIPNKESALQKILDDLDKCIQDISTNNYVL